MEANRSRSILIGLGLLLAIMLLMDLPSWFAVAGARNPCAEPGNLTRNCGFDTFVDQMAGQKRLQVPQDWTYFVVSGDLEYRPAIDTYWGAPSLWLVSDGVPFIAGIYQQVPVTPGVVYQTDIGWAAQDKPDFERKLGLDPTGGTNPQAPTIIWSRSETGFDKWPDLTVSARATGPTMTVFVWVSHQMTHGADSIFLDAVGLWPDTSQPPATVTPRPSPTATRRPPTRTPLPATYTATLTPTPTETPTLPPTDTPTATPTPTWTPTPSPVPPTATLTPSPTSTRTPVPVALVIAVPQGEEASREMPTISHQARPGQVLLYVAGGALLVGVLLGAVVLWLWLRGRKSTS